MAETAVIFISLKSKLDFSDLLCRGNHCSFEIMVQDKTEQEKDAAVKCFVTGKQRKNVLQYHSVFIFF